MNRNGFLRRHDGAFEVTGALTFQSVPEFLALSANGLREGSAPVTIDLGGVERVDSAGLALMLEWLRLAHAAGREIRFVNAPEQVRHLIRVNGLTEALNVQ